MTSAPASPEIILPVPAEPTELREAICGAVLGGSSWRGAFGDSLGVGDVLWEQWESVLEAGGLGRPDFDIVVRGYRRELWFWLLGDRSWRQVVEGLSGRMLRRLPSA